MEKMELPENPAGIDTFQNRLIHEKSPYLLQHADNPVDWYAWGEEAFEKALKEDKPIFLSIGYSTCHWCHVMEHESFEDPEIGELMNRVFVSIKVDREERPDIDGVYMRAAQMMTGRGGWPLTIIMTPDKRPFFAATYIPKESRGQMTGMKELIPLIQDVWINRRDEVLESEDMITRELGKNGKERAGVLPAQEIIDSTFQALSNTYDADFGGFGRAPKFPSPHNLLFLFRYWQKNGNDEALQMALNTLRGMRKGGIYDHLGGGFHRYATDRLWNIPHFEKMLYDQAMLTLAYTEAYQISKEPLFEETARGILDYVLRDMTSPEGGYFSAEDADSEGEEGKFYVWSYNELETLLSRDEFSLVTEIFQITEAGNYREEASGISTGNNILHSGNTISSENSAALIPIRKRLFEVREKRVHPFKDDKILTDWNGLMIAAMAKAGRILNDESYVKAAERSAAFIIDEMVKADGGLYHRYRQGEKGIPGFLEDYIFLAWGLLELYESTLDAKYLKESLGLADYAARHFWDDEGLGFYSSSDEHPSLIFREKEGYDGAIPSGNSAAMNLFLRLGRLTGRTDMTDRGENIARAFTADIQKAPSAFTFLASALSQFYSIPREIIIVGEEGDPGVDRFLGVLREGYYPNAVVLFVPSGPKGDSVRELIPYLSEYTAIEGEPTVYVCSNYACELPTRDVEIMKELMLDRK